MSKKVIHELSVEDLIDLVNKNTKPVEIEELSEASKFIYALNLKHGDSKIPAQLIYFTYKQWKGWDKRPQPKPIFFKDFAKYFDSVRTTDGINYLLDSKPFDLSREQYFLSRKDLRDHREKQKTKKETGSSQTPESKKTV